MSTDSLQPDTFLRVSSICVAVYDYLVTLPIELRVYRPIGRLKFRWSVSVVLFILIRYTSILLMAVSNFGWFYLRFSADACSVYYLVAPALKVIQIIISQVIIGYRTWNISQRSRRVGIFLCFFGFTVAILESFANLRSRVPVQDNGNCSPGNSKAFIPPWVFYLLSIVFDVTAIALSSFFLIESASSVSRMTSILQMLFYDGLGYVVIHTAVNVLNMILYQDNFTHETQSSGASFGYMVVWIMSQKFLINIHEVAEARVQQKSAFGPTDGRTARNSGSRVIRDNIGGTNSDVNPYARRVVKVNLDSNIHWKPKLFFEWGKSEIDVEDGDASSADQGQWELSKIRNG